MRGGVGNGRVGKRARGDVMLHIDLTADEASQLHDILEEDLSELRMEIAATDSMDMREELKRTEVFLKDLLKRIED
jgi:hypothetical protein